MSFRSEVSERLAAFAWSQWAQAGVLARTDRRDRWAIDPEALLLLTLEVGRNDPRLFDETLDWLVVNERLVSVQRARNLARDDADRALVDAALGWVARWRPRARLTAKASREGARLGPPEPLFRATRLPTRDPDEAFLAHGLLKPKVEPSRNSQPPDPALPANFAFRLRHLLGVGARAEAVRVLLGVDAARISTRVVAASAGYSKRNVHEALAALQAGGVIYAVPLGNERRFEISRGGWAALLEMEVDELPQHREWPALFYALRRILRWLTEPGNEKLSDYMRASEARRLIEEIAASLRFAGAPVTDSGARGEGYWDEFVSTVRAALDELG